jgi:hypothetical protein
VPILNRARKITLVVPAIIMVLMLIFPPYQYGGHFTLNSVMAGYRFIGSGVSGGYIDWALLLVQWGAVFFLTAITFWVTGDK